jgi:putative intracellular protease/amidase
LKAAAMAQTKKILAVMSEWGYWGIELVGPLRKLEAAGWTVEFMTPKGKRSPVLPPSHDTSYVDPPLGTCVTAPEDAAMVKEFEATNRTANPQNLSRVFPDRPYVSAPDYLRQLESYYIDRKRAQDWATSTYDALLLVGGSGPLLDMVNNPRLHDLVLGFNEADKPIAAICYGVACLVFARDWNLRKPIIAGKHVTGHCLEFDYKDGTGFVGTDLNIGPPPYVLEYMLADAVGPQGQFHGNFGKPTSVIVDYPFITARSLQCSHEFGDRFVDVLAKGMRRSGW